MNTISFTVPGRPTGKGRPKFARRGAHVTTYTDAKTVSYENRVSVYANLAMAGCAMFDGAVCVTVIAHFTPAKSVSKTKRAAMLAGDMHPVGKPDIDNLIKAVLDGLNGVAFADDSQVSWVNAGKRYAETDRVLVQIEADQPSAAREAA